MNTQQIVSIQQIAIWYQFSTSYFPENHGKHLAGLLHVSDDIFLPGVTKAQHLEMLGLVLDRLEVAGLRLKRMKCTFPTWAASSVSAGASGIPMLTELLRKIPVQPVDCASVIAQITVQLTEVVLGITIAAEFPKSKRIPPFSRSAGTF